jgi:glycosyltransferase involved in cell wall biosynthesis
VLSVIIPSRNRADLLPTAVGSVLGCPLITSPEQIVVVDDDSDDQTEEVVRQLGARYVRVAVHNPGASRNAGLALVQTPYVAFLDDDDAWLPGNMGAQLAALQAHPDAAFAYGITQVASPELEPLPWTYPQPPLASGIVPEQLHLAYPTIGTVLFRRAAVAEVNGFDERIPYGEEGDLMIRIAARHQIIGVEVVGMLARLRPPGRARCDYRWGYRKVTWWRPKDVGVGPLVAARFVIDRREHFFHRFFEDAWACSAVGPGTDTIVCVARAAWMSPPHAVRHARTLASLLVRSIRRTEPTREPVSDAPPTAPSSSAAA